DAANPQAPPAITRTPMPSDSDSGACPTRPFLVVSERLRIATTRVSALVTARTDAAPRARRAAAFISDLTYHGSCGDGRLARPAERSSAVFGWSPQILDSR